MKKKVNLNESLEELEKIYKELGFELTVEEKIDAMETAFDVLGEENMEISYPIYL